MKKEPDYSSNFVLPQEAGGKPTPRIRFLLPKSLKAFSCLLIFLLSVNVSSLRASNTGEDDPTRTENGQISVSTNSDWFITVSWTSSFTSGSCDCGVDERLLEAYSGGYIYGTSVSFEARIDVTNLPGANSAKIVVGPEYNKDWYMNLRTLGEDKNVFGTCAVNCSQTFFIGSRPNPVIETPRTVRIKNPKNVTASQTNQQGSQLKAIKIRWEKGSDIPDSLISYRVYRDGVPIADLAGDEYEYLDTQLSPGTSYVYTLKTFISHQDGITLFDFKGWEKASTGTDATGKTLALDLDASDGTSAKHVRLTWPGMATSVDNFRLERKPSGGSYEEIAILNKNATSYTDSDPIPGFAYSYQLSALDPNGATIQAITDDGHRKPNGIIKGKVISRGGAGVQNVTLTVTYDGSLPTDKAPANTAFLPPYTIQTDVDGYYEVRNIYYYDSARFQITPSYQSHGFTPEKSFRILDVSNNTQAGIDFTDTTAITVAGKVNFRAPDFFGATGDDCGVEGAKVTINGTDFGIRSDETGYWSFSLSDSGNYSFEVSYLQHSFQTSSQNFDIGSDKTNIDFLDIQEDSIVVRVQDACQNPLATLDSSETPQIRVIHKNGQACFDGLYPVNANGFATLVLPASEFKLSVDNTPSAPHRIFDAAQRAQLDTVTFGFDLGKRDSAVVYLSDTVWTITPPKTLSTLDSAGNPIVIPGDTSLVITRDSMMKSLDWQADFVYFGSFELIALWENAGAEIFLDCNTLGASTGDSVIVLASGQTYPLAFQVRDAVAGCVVDTGSIKIWDFASDRENSPLTIPIQNGLAFYEMTPGTPNVASGGAHPYQKYLYLETTAGARSSDPSEWWAMVTGAKQLTPTFTSRSPEFPTLVVHDPPGDNSYSWVEKGSTYRSFENTSYEISGSGGVYTDLTLGIALKTPFFDNKVGIHWKFELNVGRENFFNSQYESNVTFTETFSTSDDPLFTGHDGDVYIGKATNQQFAVAKVLSYNQSASCEADVSDEPAMYVTGIASTFIYTEKHVKNVLIPQIVYLDSILRRQARKTTDAAQRKILISEADSFGMDASNWRNIVIEVDSARGPHAQQVENISFSAGATYEKVVEVDSTIGGSYLFTNFVDLETSIGAKLEVDGGGWLDNTAGFAFKARHSFTKDKGEDSTKSFKVGYKFADKDIGDFFSVNVKKDLLFGVPAFELYAGTSSCPHEDGTQPRDAARLEILPPVLNDIPNGGTGIYTAYLTNESESQEAREYHVRVIPQTNPLGAVVKVGGRIINNTSASFFLDPFQTAEVVLTVEQGPSAANYEDIAVMMYPPCEYELWENNGNLTSGDTVWISANFQSECTNISLNEPVQGWLVNGNSNNSLLFDLAGYDLNNPYFESVTIEYKPNGQGWLDGPTILREDITNTLYTYLLDVSGYSDGAYTVRARANCGSGKGKTYSSAISGIIDRNSIGPFGTPTPSDGFLRLGQDISVTFDKNIDCGFTDPSPTYPVEISLMRSDDSTFIPLTIQCSENEDRIILVPTIDLFSMPELENVLLVASVLGIQDDQGNRQDYPISWAFIVNASPVNWDPDTLNIALAAGFEHTISSTLKNTSVRSKAFTIEKYPTWLTPTILSGAVLSDGEYEINFLVDPGLPVGMYTDTVVAMINGWPEHLIINYEALAVPPNWNVDAGKYSYSMNMVLAFSLDQSDTNLSRDERDLVAAIYNGEIRGVAQLEYVSRFNKYLAFLTVFSDIPANEELSFSLWRASSGVEYIAKETYFFASEQIYGQINNPEILHTDGVFQLVPLQQGWNWVSLNVDNADMTINNLLNSLGSPEVGNNITVKRKDGQTATYTQIATPIIYANQWSGNLTQLDNKQAYLIHLSHAPDTLRIPGKPITTYSNIDVLSGWNWIGFQPQTAQPIGDALSSLNLRNLDLLKGQQAFSQYHKGTDTWFGPLRFMEPGKGYKLKLKDGQTYNDLTYSRLGLKDFVVDHTKYESSMTLIASIGELAVGSGQETVGSWQLAGGSTLPTEDWILKTKDRLLVGAFIDDTCRGYGFVEYVPFLEEYRVIFSLQGNASDIGRKLTFKVYDTQSGQEFISDKMEEVYITDRILGEMMEPFVLFERLELPEAGYFLEQNYPNPYDSKTTIRFILPEAGLVKLTVYDQMGKIVKVLVNEDLSAGEHTAIFEAENLPAGVYHYTIEAGEFRASRKMVKM